MPKLQGFKVFPNFENSTIFQFYGVRPCRANFDFFVAGNNFQREGKKFSVKKTPFYLFTDPKNLKKCQSYRILKFF